jgi:hypothetical protein
MGIEGNFRHVSSALLDVVQQDLEVLNAYLCAHETIKNKKLSGLRSCTKGISRILRRLASCEPRVSLQKSGLLRKVQNLSELRVYLYDQGFSESIDLILEEELWRLGRLDIESDWHAMHYLLTSDATLWEECDLPFIVTRQEQSDRLLINAVMGGTEIQGTSDASFMDFGPIRYLTQDETRNVAEALSRISEEEFERRCEDAERASPRIYPTTFQDGESENYWCIFQCISEYCKLAAEKERAMLLYLGCFYGVDFEWEDPCVTGITG